MFKRIVSDPSVGLIRICTMSTLTTQSISLVGAPLVNTSHAVQLARASQAGVQAGTEAAVNRSVTAVQALNNATSTQNAPNRSSRYKPRTEDSIDDQSEDIDQAPSAPTNSKPGLPRINKFV
jgi:hypothetical protein